MPAATRDRAIRQAIAVDRQLSGQPGQLAQLATAAAALAKAGQPDAAQVLTGPVSPGPPGGIAGLAGAFPLPNTAGLLRGTNERSTTVITFLYFRPGTSFGAQTAGANAYVHWFLNHPADDVVGVTGPVPAEYDQSQIIGKDLLWVELFTVLAIALIVGLRFRSVGAPLATLACAATAYVLAVRVVAWLAQRMGVSLPPDLDPVLVVLLLGVTTDYTVFFLDGMRARLAEGVPRVRAARLATAEFAPIILAAGVIVAAATASLAVARTKLLSAFGPGLALTVLTAMAVSMTLGPALMAIFGGLLFRPVPRWLRRQGVSRREGGGARGRQPTLALEPENASGPARRGAARGAADRRGGHGRPARGRLGRPCHPSRITADQGAPGVVASRARGHRRGGRLRARHLVPDRDPGHRPGRGQADRGADPAAARAGGSAGRRGTGGPGEPAQPVQRARRPGDAEPDAGQRRAAPPGSWWWRRPTRSTRPPSAASARCRTTCPRSAAPPG